MSYFDDNEDYIIYGGRGKSRNTWSVVCKHCGAAGLKWRLDGNGSWRLYENERIEHNRLKPHECGNPADDFEVLD